ncbi:zinc ABC transporter substrate-binding protein [Nocardioides sp. GY 10127]|uniref:metal ABC transporter substrate-binding protein n=1 Tax=Nocardioides sp. GY 10127 TaxID=2569762 RepID=UPI001458BCF3|nr:zinc ABC transporter substrate-binding protein [Nocardioides sp. GY 10127]
MLPRSVRSSRARRPVALAAAGLLAVAATGALSGCSAFSDGADSPRSAQDGTVRVATAFYALEFVADRVTGGGALAQVDDLTQPGQEPHDLELTVAETEQIADADVVLYETALQPTVADAVEQNATGATIDVGDVVDLLTLDDEGGHDEESLDGEAEQHVTDAEGNEIDPHFWLDPTRLAQVADALADALAEADPDHAEEYAANAADLVSDLADLDAAYTQGLAQCARSTIVVSHDAFGYLERYGLTVEGIAGLSPDAEPTPADLARLHALIESDGITTVFGERLAPASLSRTLADDAGVTTAVLDPIEGLTDETADEDYLSLMQENLAALEKADGCR